MNKRGFTLVELLATLTILSLIMAIAVPNVMSIIDKNKRTTYIEDAKKLVTQADYKFRMSQTIAKPTGNECVVFKMKTLDISDLKKGPEGSNYDYNNSFVAIKYQSNKYIYMVHLFEKNKSRGTRYIESSKLNEEASGVKYVIENANSPAFNLTPGITLSSTNGTSCVIKVVN